MKFILTITEGLFILLLISTLFSCEEIENNHVDLPDFEPELVVHSFISPSDTAILLHIGTTRNIFGKLQDYPKYLPAKAWLIDGSNTIAFGNIDSTGICSLKYAVQPGESYKITAECQGYPSVTATTSVPESGNFDIEVDTFTTSEILYDYSYTFLNLKIHVRNTSGRINYCRLYGFLTTYTVYDTLKYNIVFDNNVENTETTTTNILETINDGGEKVYNAKIYIYPGDTTTHAEDIRIVALNTDYDYYRFHISEENYTNTDNPFSEFAPVFSNIENGKGIFCSYIKNEEMIKIK